MSIVQSLLLFILLFSNSDSSHFRGGTISWAPVDPYASTSSVQVQISMRFFWYLYYSSFIGKCDSAAAVAAGTLYGDTALLTSMNGPVWSLSTLANCYGYNTANEWSAAKRNQTVSVITSTAVSAKFTSCCWITGVSNVQKTNSWSMIVTMNLAKRADTGKINSSPITSMAPFAIISANCTNNRSISIPVSDPDNDVVRCRCNNNICLPFASIDQANCILYFNPTVTGYYSVEIQIEDFASSSSTVALSSVPLVFLVNVTNAVNRCYVCSDGSNSCCN